MTGSYEGRVALVTGASRGIGLSVAQRLSAAGAALMLNAHPSDEDELAAAAATLRDGGTAVAAEALDLCMEGSSERLVETAVDELGGLDVVVANAGVSSFGDWLDAPPASFRSMVAVNLNATHELLKVAGATLADRGGGAIAITASTSAWLGDEQMVEYNTAKAGVVGLARSLAVALARFDIRVNAVAPGWVATEMARDRLSGPYWEMARERIPLRRAADPSEVSAVIAWICSAEASYVTGAVIPVDGGLTAGFANSLER